MLYLFNSGLRPLYQTNVLNTLALPEGYNNEYRYKHTGDSRQISPALYSSLGSLPRDEECVIIFINRFGENGYVYHPLRLATFVTYRDVNEYIHFRVCLLSFIYPRNLAAFNLDLTQTLVSEGLPRLTNGDPKNTRDGNYVIKSPSIFGNADEYQKGDPAWNSAVEDVSHTPALNSTTEQAPIFFRLDIQTPKRHKRLLPSVKDESTLFALKKNTRYESIFTYRFPMQRNDQTARGQLDIDFGDSLKGQGRITIDTHANSLVVPFSTKRYVEETAGSFAIRPVLGSGQPNLLLANATLQYQLEEGAGFWVQVVIALLLFSLVGALIGVDLAKVQPFTLGGLFIVAWPKLLFGLIQTSILFWLFRLIGKKLL